MGDPLQDFLQSIPPEKLAQILGSGTLDQNDTMLQQQIAQAHASRQARMQNQPYGAGAGMAAGLSSILGGVKEGILQNRQQEAIQKRQSGLEAFGQAAQGGNTRGAALLALLSGNKQLEGIGQNLQAQPGIDLANQKTQQEIANAGPQKALGGQTPSTYEVLTKRQGAENANQKTQQEIANAGPQKALGGQTPSTYEVLTKRQGAEKFAVNPVTGAIYDVRSGKPVSDGGTGGAGYDKRLPGMQQKFAQDFDPNIARGGVNKGNQERLNAANRLLAVATDPLTGGPADLTPQQMSEVSASLATLIGGGSSGEGTRHELTPFTGGRKLADVLQWFTNEPHGTGQQAFVQQMIATAKREQGVAQQAIEKSHAQRLSNHLQYYRTFPNEAKAQMEAYGIDPSAVDLTTGKYTPKVAAPPPAGPAPAPPDAAAELRKKYGL